MESIRARYRANFINGCNVMLEVLDRAGPFDETLKYTQDYDYRCAWPITTTSPFLDRLFVRYRIHPHQTTQQRA